MNHCEMNDRGSGRLGGPSWHAKLEEGEAGGRRLLRRFGRRFTPLFTMAAEAAVAVSYCHYTTADNSGKSEADLRLPPPSLNY